MRHHHSVGVFPPTLVTRPVIHFTHLVSSSCIAPSGDIVCANYASHSAVASSPAQSYFTWQVGTPLAPHAPSGAFPPSGSPLVAPPSLLAPPAVHPSSGSPLVAPPSLLAPPAVHPSSGSPLVAPPSLLAPPAVHSALARPSWLLATARISVPLPQRHTSTFTSRLALLHSFPSLWLMAVVEDDTSLFHALYATHSSLVVREPGVHRASRKSVRWSEQVFWRAIGGTTRILDPTPLTLPPPSPLAAPPLGPPARSSFHPARALPTP